MENSIRNRIIKNTLEGDWVDEDKPMEILTPSLKGYLKEIQ